MSSCCTTPTDPATDKAVTHCPSCGERGHKVKPVTVPALARPGTVLSETSYRLCKTHDCEVAWFGEQSGQRIPVSASTVRIGHKETAADRPICYCFGYSAQDILKDTAEDSLSISKTIAARCKQGEDSCPSMNPQGSCCLGDVRAVLKTASPAPASCSS